MTTMQIWTFAAGIGLFLYAILLAEEALKGLAGRSFKALLKKHTNNHLKSIAVGTFSTAVLQSSSAVTLMLLAFVGSGVIAFSNALGIILGANLGTTFTGWVVSTFGFKLDIHQIVFPLIALGSIIFVFGHSRKHLRNWGQLVFSFGLLFFGLSLMKDSIANIHDSMDISKFADYGILSFAIIGLVFTAIIQSSSAAMVIALTALNAGLISLSSGAAFVIGADLGTTITVILGSLAGSPAKRRVAAAHFTFNLVTDLVALLLLPLLLPLIVYWIGENAPLYSLVLFHSSFNLIGLLIFFPFLRQFASFIETRIQDQNGSFLFEGIQAKHPDATIEALLVESKRQIRKAMTLNLSVFKDSESLTDIKALFKSVTKKDYSHNYATLKSGEALIAEYALRAQTESLSFEQAGDLKKIFAGVRHCSASAKNIKDISHNIEEFRNSSNPVIHEIYDSLVQSYCEFHKRLDSILDNDLDPTLFASLSTCQKEIETDYHDFVAAVKLAIQNQNVPSRYIPNLFNTNRELYNSKHSIIMAAGEVWLSQQQSEDLNQLSAQ